LWKNISTIGQRSSPGGSEMRIGDQTVDLRAAISISYRRGCAA
jgi:hypothetical protein